ncbi:Zinc finger protein [Armadillidium vulgare]|nr:Zinc finger protein [Armadillidium vulgare]
MDNLVNNKEDSEINTSNVSTINLTHKKKDIYEDAKNLRESQSDFDNSLPNSPSNTKNKNGLNSDGSCNESDDDRTSPTYISKNYEPLSSSAEDGEDSVSSFIDAKSSEFNKNILETASRDMNVDILNREEQEAKIDMSSHKLTGQSLSSPGASLVFKSVKRKFTDVHDDEIGSKHSQNVEKFYTRQSREKILKLDSDIGEDFEASLSDNVKKNVADIKTEHQGQFQNKPSHSQKMQSNLESKEKSTASFHSKIKLGSINILNNILENKLTSTISEQLINENKVRLQHSPERIVKTENPEADSQQASTGSETPNRLSIDTDEMIPIQAEVVMSDESENELVDKNKNNAGDRSTDNVKKEVEDYLASFLNGTENGNLVEYPPQHNEVPNDCSDLTSWQLETVSLPPFRPFVEPPTWLRFTIPAEGYKCNSCGDIFYIESSLVQHKERRSVWITLDCSPCNTKLTFYNKCALKGCHCFTVDRRSGNCSLWCAQFWCIAPCYIISVSYCGMHGKTNKKRALSKSPSKSFSTLHEQKSGKENHPEISQESTSLTSPVEISQQSECLSTPLSSPLTSKKSVRCYLCERMFYSVRELMSHMRTNQSSSDQRVECRKCLLVLPSVCAAKAHILTHPPANSTNISVCPECGSRCDGPRDFVHHLNTCGHQYQKIRNFMSGISPGKQVFATFKCLLTCPLCPHVVQLHTQEERETHEKIRAHLNESHPSAINRVYYVYKSKFCTNAFRSKDELRAHHDREHRRDNHYRTKTCTLHHEVLGFQHQYFNGQEPRNAFISLSVALSQEEMEEAQTMDVPTVSSVVDTALFPHGPMTLETLKTSKVKEKIRETTDKSPSKTPSTSSPSKINLEHVESLQTCICYRCGYTYTSSKDVRRHKRSCEGESSQRLCQICGVTAIGEEFSRHCKIHIDEGLFLCMYCNGAPFSSSQILLQHFEFHVHEQFSYPAQCPFCPYIMSDVTTALFHVQEEHEFNSGTDSLNVECDRCHRNFHGERGLSIHLTRCNAGIVSPNKINSITNASVSGASSTNKQCLICKKGLSCEMYGKHIINHLEEGLLVCGLCDGLSFPSSMSLLHHLEEHSSNLQLPFPCPICSYTMTSSQDALTHLKEDHGFGNLICSSCEMNYNFTYQLQRHVDIVHKVCLYAKRRYICWICRAYDHVKKETLMNHFRNIHGLTKEEVDEKVMIRTRGQGTMPTSQFIPTKPLGSKKLGGSKSNSNSKRKLKSNSDLSKLENTHKALTENGTKLHVQNVIKKEALDIIQNASNGIPFEPFGSPDIVKVKLEPNDLDVVPEVDQLDTKPSNNPPVETPKKICPKISIKIKNSNSPKIRDKKLRDRTKVLIKRLPESALRSKKTENNFKIKTSKDTKLRKKKKTFSCDRCSYGTNSKEKFEYHKSKHEDNGLDGFLCSVCGQSFVVEPSLKRHMFFAHKIKQKSLVQSKAPQAPNKAPKALNKALQTSNKAPQAPNKASQAPSKAPQAPNKAPQTSNKAPKAPNKSSQAPNKAPQTLNKAPQTSNKAPQTPNKTPQTPNKAPQTPNKAPQALNKAREYTVEITSGGNNVSNKKISSKNKSRTFKGRKTKIQNKKITRQTNSDQRQRITIKIKSSPVKVNKEDTRDKKEIEFKEVEESNEESSDNLQCSVCKKAFINTVQLYSHLRTHGMAFLKHGRKKRHFVQEKTTIQC